MRTQLPLSDRDGHLAEFGYVTASGVADYDAMTAQIATDQAKLVLIASRAQRLQDVIGLYVACRFSGWTAGRAQDAALAR